ncbi:uncharacterized protein LOC121941522 [Plectropomus leopardus]|uniref:uncharacterized protein LOC121941522 n=1 Tax=Plectropomus leopardus TaxID=160734 RepID=UPI001C4BBE43|nr:uncharacterized protein LOC121941522 [Plectropomus leopardus]XP_042340266.1 uncharacterized protein LOC121941522 [Plectropomus leopardus]
MVQWQLCTLEQLMNSGFGRPFPRHGLQLLFWFANQCVTCELLNSVVVMKLVSDCQPEKGFYGFHIFGNVEELLPVLNRPRNRKRKTKVLYYEVGNLNTETYPTSADLPTYVRENYGLHGNSCDYNIDRIIISYQVKTRVVEMVYVTEHDGVSFGKFNADRTYQVSLELIQALQNPQLDLTAFLTQTGYWGNMQVVRADNLEMHYPELSAQQMFDWMQNYSGYTARTVRDGLSFFEETFNQQLNVNREPFSYDQNVYYNVNTTSNNSGYVARYSDVQQRPRVYRDSNWIYDWKLSRGFHEADKKGNGGGGISFVKILLGAGALYLAAKCFSWLRSCWKEDLDEYILKKITWRTPVYQHHPMLDYVY